MSQMLITGVVMSDKQILSENLKQTRSAVKGTKAESR